MAWKWFWNTETKYYDEAITRDTDWGGDESTGGLAVSGGRVQEWLKNEINGKYGVIRVSSSIDERNYYSLELFATIADEELYDSNPEQYADLVTRVPIPISAVQGDSYASILTSNIGNAANIVSVKDTFLVPFNFRSVKITSIDKVNMNARGTLTVQRSTDDGKTWALAATINNALPSEDYSNTSSYTDIDLAPYLVEGKQMIRVRASYSYEDEFTGQSKSVNSSWVLVGNTVTKTQLRLELNRNYETPIQAYNSLGQPNSFPLDYFVYGAVAKTLHVEIQGSVGTMTVTKDLTSEVDSTDAAMTAVAENSAYGILSHGVHRVKAWMTADDGLGNTITSNVLVNRLMVVNPNTPNANLLKPYLMIQNLTTEVTNYVQASLCDYAVYSPVADDEGNITNNGNAISVAFLLTDYTEDYEANPPHEYFRIESAVLPNTKNTLLSTIEIETEDGGEEQTRYDAYFRARRLDSDTDFLYESTGDTFYSLSVDNSQLFSPVAGATFLLNPKVRNNSEDNPARILNARDNNAEVRADFEGFGFVNDGWVTASDGQKVLRVPAGAKLTIHKNVFAQFLDTPNSSMTMEIDFAVHNVVNEHDPIINASEYIPATGGFRGLRMNALDGWLRTTSFANDDDTLFSWGEGKRTHISVNIHHNVRPNKGDVYYPSSATNADGSIALARVLVDGDPYREFPFNTAVANEWTTTQDGAIVIGNNGADIDIYSLRIYENKSIEMADILNRNVVASQPTSQAKVNLRERNNILTTGRIDIEKVKRLGINCMVWHGEMPYYYNQSSQKGWYEYFRFDEQGNYLPEYSGTNCMHTKSLETKGQGSTAKTYYDWNMQDDNSKVVEMIDVLLADFHESIHVSEPYEKDGAMFVDIYGGNLGKNYPIENTPVAYAYSDGYVHVPDGWIDGNGKYRGMGYMVEENTALAQKKVIKINVASSMQSHLLAACKTYDLLHRKVVGDTPLQKVVPTAVTAKHTAPFMLFNQQEGSAQVYYKGMGNYGAGKMDKVAWGYVKKLHPMFALIEGSDNNLPMTGFRVPFDKLTAVYSPDDEGWLYDGKVSWDFDGGKTVPYTEQNDGWQFKIGKETEVPDAAIRDRWAAIHNFIYLHAPNIQYYVGTSAQFLSDTTTDTNKKYFCTGGSDAYRLFRYDHLNGSWVDAGLLGSDGKYRTINLKTDSVTKPVYDKAVSDGTAGVYQELTKAFNAALAAHFKANIEYFISGDSLRFCYAYVLAFLAGTDNSDKNTYFEIMPYAEDMSAQAATAEGQAFASWYSEHFGEALASSEVYKVYLNGDDMDSIFKTNNNSHQTKPYYIDRMHPAADDDPEVKLYEGLDNALFNLCELAYEATGELPSMMNAIMTAATELVAEEDNLYGLTENKRSVWGFLHKYFFNTQYYFPQIAYIEQARIRYEFPELIGFISQGAGARQIRPITQSLGSQLQNELAYMTKRLIYMASYANFGAFFGNTSYSIGLADAADSLSWMPSSLPDGKNANYIIELRPHQYIYPTGAIGQTNINPHARVSPNETYRFTIATNQGTSDTGISIFGINYYSSVGNFGDVSVQPSRPFSIVGKRLTEFIANPTVLYNGEAAFRPQGITIKAPQIRVLSLNGCNAITGSADMTQLTRCQSIDLSNTRIYDVLFPASDRLTTIKLGAEIEKFSIENTPNLTDITFSSYEKIASVIIGKNVGALDTQTFVARLRDTYQTMGNVPELIRMYDINWVDTPISTIDFLLLVDNPDIKGTITLFETTPTVTFEKKLAIIRKFGNVDDVNSEKHKGLVLVYQQVDFTSASTITGNFQAEEDKRIEAPFSVTPNSVNANTMTDIIWSIGDNGFNESQGFIDPVTGVLTVTKVSEAKDEVDIKVSVHTFSGGIANIVELTKTINVAISKAQLGDLVYADGTFGRPEDYDGTKTVIGICFYIAPTYSDGSIVSELFNPNDKQTRLMVATKDIGAYYWGAFKKNYSDGLWVKIDDVITYLRSDTFTETTLYDIQDIRNLSSTGVSGNKVTADSIRDETSELGILNDGFAVFDVIRSAGDGFAYNESEQYVSERTLNESLPFDRNNYSVGDIVNSAFAKTLAIIKHRNMVLSETITAQGLESPLLSALPIPKETSTMTEMESLTSLMTELTNYARDVMGDSNPSRWTQLYWPAASAAYAYEPSVAKGEVLSDKFKKHNWFLPTYGLLARIVWYYTFGGEKNIFAKAQDMGLFTIAKTYYRGCGEISIDSADCLHITNGSQGGMQLKNYDIQILPITSF